MTKKTIAGREKLRRRTGILARALRSRPAFAESYREVVELAPIGIFTSTLEGRFLAANAALAKILGYDSVEEVLRIDIPKDLYFSPRARERVYEAYERSAGIVRVETVLKK